MTIAEALARIDSMKPNSFTDEDKIYWLSTLDGKIKKEIIDTHEDGEDITFNGYTADTSRSTNLIAEAPYDELYIYYLAFEMDYFTGEFDKANNSGAMYKETLNDYIRYYNRMHMPKAVYNNYF